jgi:hypothetical protein
MVSDKGWLAAGDWASSDMRAMRVSIRDSRAQMDSGMEAAESQGLG